MKISKILKTSVLVVVFLVLSISNISAIEHTFSWSKRLGGSSSDDAKYFKADSLGNAITAGQVIGNADLNGDGDSTDGGGEDATGYGSNDIYISSFDSNGNSNWYKRLGSTGNDDVMGFVIDSSNNIYVFGWFTGNADLNGDGDSTDGDAEDATGYGTTSTAITSFDSDGNYRWSKRFGSTGIDSAISLHLSSSEILVLLGSYADDADLNGDGDNTDGGAETATGLGAPSDVAYNVFNTSGVYQNSNRIGAVTSMTGKGITTDSANNIIITANANGNADLTGDGDTNDGNGEDATGYGSNDSVVSVFNSSGTYQWSKRLGNTAADGIGYPAVMGDGSVVLQVYANGNADLTGDGDTNDGNGEDATGYSGNDAFISVFSSSGTYQWSKRLGGANSDIFNDIFTDDNDNVLIQGTVNGDADLNGDGDSLDGNGESAGSLLEDDVFVSSFSSSGVYIWSKRLGGNDWDTLYGSSIIDSSGNSYITGVTPTDADLNGDGDTNDTDFGESSTGYGFDDIYIAVFNSSGEAQWAKRFGSSDWDATGQSSIDSNNNLYIIGGIVGAADFNGDGDTTDSQESSGYGSYDIFISVFEYQAPAVVVDDPVTTSTVVVGEETIQIPASSSFVSQNIITQPIKDSNTGGQDILGIIQPGTIIFDAYFSSNMVSKPSQIINLSNIPSNIVIGGNDGIIGIKSLFTTYWQVGNIQQMWLKTYPPAGHSAAIIVRELQEKPSIVAFKYTDEHLKPIGRPDDRYNPKYFKIAHSIDGVNWKVLNNSVVDTTNKTVAVIDEIGGYYVLVNK
jgi:hypothetical protein